MNFCFVVFVFYLMYNEDSRGSSPIYVLFQIKHLKIKLLPNEKFLSRNCMGDARCLLERLARRLDFLEVLSLEFLKSFLEANKHIPVEGTVNWVKVWK